MKTSPLPKATILKDFATLLHARNPMNIALENKQEYENEALSILSRFSEAALQLSDDEAIIAQLATAIVRQALEFWFDDIGTYDPEPLARELASTYRKAHGVAPKAVVREEFITEPEHIAIGG